MKTSEMMLRSHPRTEIRNLEFYADALVALRICHEVCTACADACLGEPEHLGRLHRCIRVDLDCADVCLATARLLVRQTETPH
ncbi:MAG: four-helix bundle copper-binding protein, partial [Opitutaceae bacterium]